MRNIKLTIAYDGTNYHGFQEQRGTGLVTIQEVLEKCLSRLAGRPVRVIGAGRTDAGVHARGQVVNFDAAGWGIPAGKIVLALNGVLPPDMAALHAEEVPPGFHARFSARTKTYRYTIYNSRIPSPFWRLYSYFVPRPLDVAAMKQAAAHLVGRHDFASFQAAGSPVKDTVRTLFEAAVEREGEEVIHLVFRGDGFLYNMVRIMVGTLVEVGLHKRDPVEVTTILAARNRVLAGPTVPPQGLCLERVEY
ncbi:tRNA pseudouridine(38-40) synthase TruA [Desulfofundulus thermobenzoicus]|uniref:tRNA pseudouridine synthase A n=1 Tax=Desulfofundulus thermobenzoicus TaxID=29376 RepID=A0A6N7ILT9_9FIRM|nr:tRNA pseudouridine(38-40) synthase TruA [Desulfofundulus thermobenzoicus]MQL50946.1 tRNA pseudouridine(38-40) synthase TruA [Desulfofundulus thermobenzoicus]HHW42884.1 tRNA pseudouridine(38-40) synthase TruA [Desulfotomaculum sp.]